MAENDNKKPDEKDDDMQRARQVSASQPSLPIVEISSPTIFRAPKKKKGAKSDSCLENDELPMLDEEEVSLVERAAPQESAAEKEMESKAVEEAPVAAPPAYPEIPPELPPQDEPESLPPPLPSKEEIKRKLEEAKQAEVENEEPPPMPEVTPKTVVTGEVFRKMREAQGLSLEDVRKATKISLKWIEVIENDRFSELPQPVYTRGYLTALAKFYGLDERQTLETYLNRFRN